MTTPNVSLNSSGQVDLLEAQAVNASGEAGTEENAAYGALTLSLEDLSPLLPGDSSKRTLGKRAFGIADRMAEASTLENLYQITVSELRKQFQCDRAIIYRIQSQVEGRVIAESVTAGYTPALGDLLNLIAFGAAQASDYQTQLAVALCDASEEAVSPHQMQLLQRFQVQASLSLPIFAADRLWGLLVLQQCDAARTWQEKEIGLLYQASTELALQLQAHELRQQVKDELARGETLADITQTIREVSSLQQVFDSTTRSLRSFLKADRVAVFQFIPGSSHGKGKVIAENVDSNYTSAKEVPVEDHCFGGKMSEAYRLGRTWMATDIYEQNLPECHTHMLSQFQVRANLVVPLLKGNELWGLFCIHQCSGPRQWQAVEAALVKRISAQLGLAMQQADYREQVQEKNRQLEDSVAKEQLVTKITERLRSPDELSKTLRATVQDIRELIQADRVGLFQFDESKNYSVGEFVIEDVSVGTRSLIASQIQDHCFAEGQAENYRKGRQWVVNDVRELDIPDCLASLLSQMQVSASIVVPLLKGDALWGLFAIHQCYGPREWEEADVQFAQRIGAQLNVALQQADYLSQVQEKSLRLSETAEREKASKELLQEQVITLLKAVGPALQGDLTVRAPVTETEVGTVASAYNNTLGSLQKIVLQVQAAVELVGETSRASENSAASVTQQAQQQAAALAQALTRVQKMVDSTAAVAQDAQQVETAARQANQVVQRGDTAMNLTVDGITAIRTTVAETNQRVKRLSESSQKVSKIVSLISHFTTQTQLLALNASIEATRAGQYGRGFAVVADEVRSLARQSAAAAAEIEQFVQEIQMGTAEVSTAMETGIQQVAEGTSLVTDARQSLTAIVEATDQISQLIADITQTTHQQADEFKEVTQTMTEATEIAHQTSVSSSELVQAIQQVLETSGALQSSAGKFKAQ